jgi:hypothetical protein
MQRKFFMFFCVWSISFLNTQILSAQKKALPATPAPAVIKKPNVKSFLGATATGTMEMTAEEANKLISLPLRIIDDKNVGYLISSYQFAYKRIGVTEDEVTGKISAQSDIAADRFTSTPLPVVWQNNIKDGLHKGEELYFFDIIAINNTGIRFFAPELKITIL